MNKMTRLEIAGREVLTARHLLADILLNRRGYDPRIEEAARELLHKAQTRKDRISEARHE
jgi:hypothetical protein